MLMTLPEDAQATPLSAVGSIDAETILEGFFGEMRRLPHIAGEFLASSWRVHGEFIDILSSFKSTEYECHNGSWIDQCFSDSLEAGKILQGFVPRSC